MTVSKLTDRDCIIILGSRKVTISWMLLSFLERAHPKIWDAMRFILNLFEGRRLTVTQFYLIYFKSGLLNTLDITLVSNFIFLELFVY